VRPTRRTLYNNVCCARNRHGRGGQGRVSYVFHAGKPFFLHGQRRGTRKRARRNHRTSRTRTAGPSVNVFRDRKLVGRRSPRTVAYERRHIRWWRGTDSVRRKTFTSLSTEIRIHVFNGPNKWSESVRFIRETKSLSSLISSSLVSRLRKANM